MSARHPFFADHLHFPEKGFEADPSKARDRLGWQARTSFAELVGEMVTADLEQVRREGGNGPD